MRRGRAAKLARVERVREREEAVATRLRLLEETDPRFAAFYVQAIWVSD